MWAGLASNLVCMQDREEKCHLWLVAHNDSLVGYLVTTTLGCLRMEGDCVHTYKRAIFIKWTSPLY